VSEELASSRANAAWSRRRSGSITDKAGSSRKPAMGRDGDARACAVIGRNIVKEVGREDHDLTTRRGVARSTSFRKYRAGARSPGRGTHCGRPRVKERAASTGFRACASGTVTTPKG